MKLALSEGADPRFSVEAWARRQAALLYAQGYISETTPRGAYSTSAAETAGQISGAPLGLARGDTVTGLAIEQAAAATTITLGKLALISLAGVVLGVTADQSATWNASGGERAIPFLSPVLITDDDAYYACHLQVGGTPAGFSRGAGVAGAGGGGAIIGAGRAGLGFKLTGQADFPAVGSSLSVATINNVKHWLAAF